MRSLFSSKNLILFFMPIGIRQGGEISNTWPTNMWILSEDYVHQLAQSQSTAPTKATHRNRIKPGEIQRPLPRRFHDVALQGDLVMARDHVGRRDSVVVQHLSEIKSKRMQKRWKKHLLPRFGIASYTYQHQRFSSELIEKKLISKMCVAKTSFKVASTQTRPMIGYKKFSSYS